ncbi:MAG: hypothetical protein ACR2NP_18815 [Pirellulaceae bacterium]
MTNKRAEGILSIVAALLVLFTNMLDPMLSVALAVTLLVAFGLYRLVAGQGTVTDPPE